MNIRLCLWLLVFFVTSMPAQIYNLSTNADGRDVYFVSTLTQRGQNQLAAAKIFLLRGGALTLLEQTPTVYPFGPGTFSYPRTDVSADGSIRTLNRVRIGACPDECPAYGSVSATIQTPYATSTFAANSVVSANGRYAALYGNKSVQLLNLETGQLTLAGAQAAQSGRMVSDDGTVLVAYGNGFRLVGPNRIIRSECHRPT